MIANVAILRAPGASAGQECSAVEQPRFEEVYQRHADGVYRFCLSQLRDAAAAEDIAADTFTAAFAAYARVRPQPDGLRPWLFRIARNAVIDQGRRHRRGLRALGLLRASSSPPADVEAQAAQRAELRRVIAAISALGRRDRELVGLRVAAGLSFAEIAEVLAISEGAARTATHRALDRVRFQEGDRHE